MATVIIESDSVVAVVFLDYEEKFIKVFGWFDR